MRPDVQRAEPAEDWSDERYISLWIERQAGRAPLRARQFKLLRALLPFAPDQRFRYVNIGAGHGPFDELVLERYPHAHATLVDGSAGMLAYARRQLERFGDRTSYVQADFSASDWRAQAGGPFEAAVSCIAIHNLFDARAIRAVYRDVYDLLGDGGVFFNLDYMRMPSAALQPLAAWAYADEAADFMMGGGGGHMPGTADEQVAWLREAGFAPADCLWKEFRVALVGGLKGTPAIPPPSARQA
jgi:tRNA (cmo5U34)-methyltransferase